MKIAIYSPYLDTAGGGEKYILTIAECLSDKEQVDVLLDQHLYNIGAKQITEKIEKLHGLNLSRVNFIRAPIGQGSSFFSRLFFLKQYDWLFYLTDGSIFLTTAKNSVIHFQVPFSETAGNWLWNMIKLMSWKTAIYNSKFTQHYVEKGWKINGQVIYPPVSVELFKPLAKKKRILTVGRFFGFLKDKKHGVLISAFKELVAEHSLHGWSLHLAGGASSGDEGYLKQLRELAEGYKIFLHPNISLGELRRLFGQSQIYWHASGFGEEDPKRFEHFGITAVEALASGCIPVVVNKGGLKEIIEEDKSGYLWNNLDQLKEQTMHLIRDEKLQDSLAKEGQLRALNFGKTIFVERIKKLIYG